MLIIFHAFVFVVDDILTPQCLREIRQIAREAIQAIEEFKKFDSMTAHPSKPERRPKKTVDPNK